MIWLPAVATLAGQRRRIFASCGESALPLNVWTIKASYLRAMETSRMYVAISAGEVTVVSPGELRGMVKVYRLIRTGEAVVVAWGSQHIVASLALKCQVLASGVDSAYCAHWACDPAASLCEWCDNCGCLSPG